MSDSLKQGEEEFRSRALAEFPVLEQDFNEYDGLLHLQMAALSRLVQKAIDRRDYPTVERGYNLLDDLVQNADMKLENAITVSFLENLDFELDTNGKEARNLLPARLNALLLGLEKHMKDLYDSQFKAK
jgi:hypothetical protein